MRFDPNGAVAVVTGASSGIGRCLCERLCDAGASVVAVARRSDRLAELSNRSAPGSITPVVGDVTFPKVRQQILDVANQIRGGEVDLLINNAGIGAIGAFADASPERLRQVMEVNFFAPAELTRILIPSLGRGRAPVICNISSVLGHRAVANKSEYCASKFAMHGWSDSLRAELAPDGIQVTLVSPSTTKSEFFDSLVHTSPDQSSASIGSWSPDRVARAALAAIIARRSEVILSLGGKALVYADRLSPPLMNRILRRR
ncbi:putative oxidoreductase [Rubripirellula lacrimiformis]|uniref:Putative oxidoreductase n=1 Tax=Rubripirellula lacrimiformis TaxID=1930273 RepID=A0A517NGV7_9BACT|nr:SDR family NAD(P)-dependent oxidoreductase [Rubripirellula lacrimiformis]QDT06370.1 putative oxidoreductase [Rubripirellula lacrimiformis]